MRMIKLLNPEMVKALYAKTKTEVDVEVKTKELHESRTHKLSSHALDSLYPLTIEKGSIGRYHPSKVPNAKVTNCGWVCDYAKTYGVRSRPWKDPFAPVKSKKN